MGIFNESLVPSKTPNRKRYLTEPPSPFSEINAVKFRRYVAQYESNQGKTYADYLRQNEKQKTEALKIGQARLKALKLDDKRRKSKPFITI